MQLAALSPILWFFSWVLFDLIDLTHFFLIRILYLSQFVSTELAFIGPLAARNPFLRVLRSRSASLKRQDLSCFLLESATRSYKCSMLALIIS